MKEKDEDGIFVGIKYWIKRVIGDFAFAVRMRWQKRTRGWSDLEIWNLDNTFCEWMIPRLKDFRARTFGYPEVPGECESLEEWQALLDEMIFGFEFDAPEWYEKNVFPIKDPDERGKRLNEYKELCQRAEDGRILFAKLFNRLWW